MRGSIYEKVIILDLESYRIFECCVLYRDNIYFKIREMGDWKKAKLTDIP
jgi:hypothetical protein